MTAQPPANSVHPQDRREWREWLQANHTRPSGIWVVLWKKASGKPVLPYDDLVEEALCFGWIDSKPNKLDANRSLLWLSPRKPATAWSALNKARIARAVAAGRMTEAGLAKIEAAKRDGSWSKLDSVDALLIPPDLEAAFQAFPGAAANFQAFPPSARRGILEWIGNARTQTTRDRRVTETARLAAINERANQWRR